MSVADLKAAYAALSGKKARLDTLFAYYDGEAPLRYSTARLSQAFAAINARFTENWCATVVDSLVDRLQLSGFKVEDAGLQDAIDALCQREALAIESDEAHEDTAVCGESYVIVGRYPDGRAQIVHNDPRLCAVFYDPADPRIKSMAAKWYLATDENGVERRHLTLYYADRFAHYVSQGKASDVSDERAFVLEGEEPNPDGAIPVFHLRYRRRKTYGELQSATELQDAVNKTLADMMVAAEYGAFKQRYIISQADVSDLKNAPNEIWNIPAGDGEGEGTQVGEFSPADLANYTGAIDHLANAMARITRTPAHYFFAQGANISGDALVAMESPLAKKAAKYQPRLAACWREVVAFALAVEGVSVDPEAIDPVWGDERTVQPATEADVVTKLVAAGVPLETALRRNGWTQADLDQLAADKDAAATSQASLAQQMLTRARTEFAQGATSPTAATTPPPSA